VENYFNYFTDIEEHFQRRRGGVLFLSTLDWALIETWKDAGIPLAAVERGIDAAFDRYDQRPSKSRKVNSLAYCSQEVLAAAEDMKEAAVGAETVEGTKDSGFSLKEIAAFLRRSAEQLHAARIPEKPGFSPSHLANHTAEVLRTLADTIEAESNLPKLEDLERKLAVAEDRIFAVLLAVTDDDEVVGLRAEADRELAPYRGKMPAAHAEQLQKQYLRKRLLEKYNLPRLSLFYM